MDDFSVNLKKLRKLNGITQDDLAQKLGIRKTTVSNYETGYSSPSKETLIKMAAYFDVTIDELLGQNKPESMKETSASLPSISINILGNVHDGNSLFKNASSYLFQEDYFNLTIDSDSMNLSRLEIGDIIIVQKRATTKNGDIVILLIDGEDTEIGHYYRRDNQITLMPNSSNKKNEPTILYLTEHHVEILGKVVKAIISTE